MGAEPDTDDSGPIGWAAPPGEGGRWSVVIDHCCLSTFEAQGFLTILGGSWNLMLPNHNVYSGSVEGGIVQFPPGFSLEEDIGCGPGVTTVSAILLFDSGGDGEVEACLDDLRGPSSQPFRFWGTIRQHQP
jgi:hypothetical protein